MNRKMVGIFTAVATALLLVGVAWAGSDAASDDTGSSSTQNPPASIVSQPGSQDGDVTNTSVEDRLDSSGRDDNGGSTATTIDDNGGTTPTTVDDNRGSTPTTIDDSTGTTVDDSGSDDKGGDRDDSGSDDSGSDDSGSDDKGGDRDDSGSDHSGSDDKGGDRYDD